METSTALKALMLLLLWIAVGFRATTLPVESQKCMRDILASNKVQPTEQKGNYLKYNFATLWLNTTNSSVVGIIGDGNRRLQMKLLSAVKDSIHADTYFITGKSKVAGNICSFSGSFTVRHIRELRKFSTRVDETASPARHEGILLAEYQLTEDNNQPAAGVFAGVLLTKWYIDKKDVLRYDDIESFADGSCNNQFVGTWTSLKSHKTLRCNWGDNRIPNAEKFDIGAGEFSPGYKPGDKEWQHYAQAWIYDNTAARRQEQKPRW
jgi:hypothetical protein